MKKHLLSTSVIALGVAAAAPAAAQDWNLDWGGYMNQHVAYADVSGVATVGRDDDGVGFVSNAEIHFTPSVTLDNGLTFGVNVQLEADNQSGQSYIDETYMTISGDQLGKIIVGSENSAGYLSMIGAPGVTSMYINSPSISGFIPLSLGGNWNFRQAGISTYTEVGGNNDVDRITYFTPNFNGFKFGVSYANNNGGNAVGSHNNSAAASLNDIFDIGMSYSGSFGGADVSFGARWGTADATAVGAGDVETWGVGARVGFSGFTIGGSYTDNDNDNGLAGVGFDQSGWSFGGTYDAPGPWAFELLTYQGEWDNTGGAGLDSDYQAYRAGASRDLGPGVDWDIYVVYAERDHDDTVGTDVKGTVIGTAINLSF